MNNENGPTTEQRAAGLNTVMHAVYDVSMAVEHAHGQTFTGVVIFDDSGLSVMAKRVPAKEMIRMLKSAIQKLRDEGDSGWKDESEPVSASHYDSLEGAHSDD